MTFKEGAFFSTQVDFGWGLLILHPVEYYIPPLLITIRLCDSDVKKGIRLPIPSSFAEYTEDLYRTADFDRTIPEYGHQVLANIPGDVIHVSVMNPVHIGPRLKNLITLRLTRSDDTGNLVAALKEIALSAPNLRFLKLDNEFWRDDEDWSGFSPHRLFPHLKGLEISAEPTEFVQKFIDEWNLHSLTISRFSCDMVQMLRPHSGLHITSLGIQLIPQTSLEAKMFNELAGIFPHLKYLHIHRLPSFGENEQEIEVGQPTSKLLLFA